MRSVAVVWVVPVRLGMSRWVGEVRVGPARRGSGTARLVAQARVGPVGLGPACHVGSVRCGEVRLVTVVWSGSAGARLVAKG